MDLEKKKVTVVGLGNSGYNAAVLLDGAGAIVHVTDSSDSVDVKKNVELLTTRPIRVEIGGHTRDFVEGSELMVVSPGVADDSPVMKWAAELKIPVISEMELGFRFCRGKIIAITGTNGKSTVSALIGEMLKDGGKDAVVCGNIGNALSGEIQRIKEDTWVVLEVSSFQLERIDKFQPHIALILNIADDHQDRYKTFREYYNEKLKIFRNQDREDYLILSYDAENIRALGAKARSKTLFYSRCRKVSGVHVDGGSVVIDMDGRLEKLFSISDIKLKGLHNLENTMAASLAAILAGVEPASLKATVRRFGGLAHRFETVGVIDGIEYIDDSKGTTVDSTYRALESCANKVILICGGRDKNSDFSVIKNLIREKVDRLILIGEAKDKLKMVFGAIVPTLECNTMEEAVMAAHKSASGGAVVLLSPMCASFDMFRDYKHRGDVFKEAVRVLERNREKARASS